MIFTRDKSFYKSLFLLALPIALQNFLTFCVGLADNIMVGTLGDAAVSGVYMGGQIQTLLQVFSGGIEGAILILAAQYWGRDDRESIRRIVAVGLRFSLLFGLALTVVCSLAPTFVLSLFTKDAEVVAAGVPYLRIVSLSYLFFCITQSLIASMRSVETPRIGLYVSALSLLINVLFNYIFIFGKLGAPALGAKGAAIATLIARIAECAVSIVYVLVIDKKLKFRLRYLFKTDREILRDFLKYGTPIILGQIVWASNMMANSVIMGRFDKSVITALSIANTLNNLSYVVMNGMAGAVGIITGKTVGAGEESKMREYAKTVQLLFLTLGFLTGGMLQLIKSPFISLYEVSGAAIATAHTFINVLSVTIIGTCYQCACLFGLVKSGGDISFVFKNDLIFVFLVVIPSALAALFLGAPAWVVFAALKCDQILKCIVAFFKIRRYDWMKNLTRAPISKENT